MNIKINNQYIEGQWAATRMLGNIENTMYGSVENAIIAKEELITQFETQLGFSRDMENLDSRYAYNCGILDILKEKHNE